MNQHDILGPIDDEFRGAEIPDWRLRERLVRIAEEMDVSPEATLPKALKTTAAREGAYRFLGNQKVTMERILGPHVQATARRCAEKGTVYVASDTTELVFNGEERGKRLGRLQGGSRGFLAHVALAISADGMKKPLGILGIDTWTRPEEPKEHQNIYQQKKDPTRESLKWGRLMVEVAEVLPADVEAIHVMDSEADIYELLHQAQGAHRYIIRSGQERRAADGLLSQVIGRSEVILTREVRLSRRHKAANRRNPARAGRLANLAISSAVVRIKRPKTSASNLPAELPVNLVYVREVGEPDGEQPVEWILFTSEPVGTEAQIAAVVDGYRCRWVIEEYFKALKTGCNYEAREFESMRTLTNFLGIAAVLAWRLLLIRSLERENSTAPATDVVDVDLLEALAGFLKKIGERKPFPASPTVKDLMTGIARLGGHITNNGPPGWLVLWRGYKDLLVWANGFLHAKSISYSDQS